MAEEEFEAFVDGNACPGEAGEFAEEDRLTGWIHEMWWGGDGDGSGPWFHPLEDLEAVFVSEGAADDDDEVDEGPDAEAAEGDDHEGGGAVFADVEAVGSEDAEEPAEEEGNETGFGGDGSCHGCEFI